MPTKSALDAMPSRIKYYLLEWKDTHIQQFLEQYGQCRLRDLTQSQLHEVFVTATAQDLANLNE
jgi:hypothetical protein